jgi:hypothetical protein
MESMDYRCTCRIRYNVHCLGRKGLAVINGLLLGAGNLNFMSAIPEYRALGMQAL